MTIDTTKATGNLAREHVTVLAHELKAGLAILMAVSETIRELGEVPSGTLYATLIGKVDFDGYEAMLRTLTNAGLIQVMPSHMIRWCGPKIEKETRS
jgi:hypothetical protein